MKRLAKYFFISMELIVVSLILGMVGYHTFESLSWVDSFMNAAILMGGMGPVNTLHTDAGKIFAGFYPLYFGLIVILAIGLFAAPIFHRYLHYFHLESEKRPNE